MNETNFNSKHLYTSSRDFSKVTAISGLLGNALDLVQHLLHPCAPSISGPDPDVHRYFLLCLVPHAGAGLFQTGERK
jgi:hypothetical protein